MLNTQTILAISAAVTSFAYAIDLSQTETQMTSTLLPQVEASTLVETSLNSEVEAEADAEFVIKKFKDWWQKQQIAKLEREERIWAEASAVKPAPKCCDFYTEANLKGTKTTLCRTESGFFSTTYQDNSFFLSLACGENAQAWSMSEEYDTGFYATENSANYRLSWDQEEFAIYPNTYIGESESPDYLSAYTGQNCEGASFHLNAKFQTTTDSGRFVPGYSLRIPLGKQITLSDNDGGSQTLVGDSTALTMGIYKCVNADTALLPNGFTKALLVE